MIAIVDAGPLFAVVDASDDAHQACLEALERRELHLVVPALVVAEVSYLVGRRLGAVVEAAFLRGLTDLDVEAPSREDWARIGELVEAYGDLPLGGADASVVALAERLDTRLIVTLDGRHLGAVQSRHCSAFTILP